MTTAAVEGGRRAGRARAGVTAAIGLLFVVAGASKLIDPGAAVAFARAAIGPWLWIDGAVSAIGVFEIALGGALVVPATRPGARHAAVAVLVVFTAMLVFQAFATDPPSCGCFGAWLAFESARAELWLGAARNVALVVALCWAMGPAGRGVATAIP